MATIKINVDGRDPLFTGMRIYRREASSNLWDPAYLIKTIAAADSFTDNTAGWDPTVSEYRYGVEFFTDSGITWRTKVYAVRNRYNLDMLHLEGKGLEHPYIWGDDSLGLWRQDTQKLFVPSFDEVFALLKTKTDSLSASGNQNQFLYSYNGSIVFGGVPFVVIRMNASSAANLLNSTFVTPLNALGSEYNYSWEIVKNGTRWRVHVPLANEAASIGRFCSPASPYTQAVAKGSTIGQLPNTFYNNQTSILTYSSTAADGTFNFITDNSATATISRHPGIFMKYMGRL